VGLRQYPLKDFTMKRLLYLFQIILIGFIAISLVFTLLQLTGDSNPLSKFDYKRPANSRVEDYDPSLIRLNSLDKLERYCDSLSLNVAYTAKTGEFEKRYSDIVSSVVRRRFYHGYSYYGFSNNYLSVLFSKLTNPGYKAIVIPDDILDYPFAACSQQSIVMMEVLKAKGFKTRKISFNGKKSGGHFCFEIFYNQSWHFYDPNMEPDVAVLNKYDRPDIAYLSNHPDILTAAYKQYPQEEVLDIFPNYTYGKVNIFPAPRAIVFQKVTKFLSYTIWLFFLISFLLIRRKYKQITSKKYVRYSRIYFPQPQRATTPSHYPGFTAPGS
jgi:hypothetical protein